jgi:ubiquitin C-terminal hydrolase
MNSALQCLSNTWPLATYFLDKLFINEINETNPLGTKGVLAFHYAKLLNEMWNKDSDVFSPGVFKREVGKQNAMVRNSLS